MESWQAIIAEYLTEQCIFHVQCHHNTLNQTKDIQICAPVLARYFQMHFASGVKRMQVSLGGGVQIDQAGALNGDEIPTTFTYYFENDTQVCEVTD